MTRAYEPTREGKRMPMEAIKARALPLSCRMSSTHAYRPNWHVACRHDRCKHVSLLSVSVAS